MFPNRLRAVREAKNPRPFRPEGPKYDSPGQSAAPPWDFGQTNERALKGRNSENGPQTNRIPRREVEGTSVIDLQAMLRPFRAFGL
jgi:hypothetical protein